MEFLLELNDIRELFEAIQKAQLFEDQKTMADAIPLSDTKDIMKAYYAEKEKTSFDLHAFVLKYFQFNLLENKNIKTQHTDIHKHITNLWKHLTQSATEPEGTKIPLPKPYIVPGGRFNEFFYWDSYFTMLGLAVDKEIELMKNIVENCAHLISTYGYVPNGNRTYFLNRSQPPYFSLMLELLIETTGDTTYYKTYYPTLQKEYAYWMNGSDLLNETNTSLNKVIRMPDGNILNRYYDKTSKPREESFMQDIELAENANNKEELYKAIRSACESGWDFSSRWLTDSTNLQTIETQNIVPIDLNCLLYNLEKTIYKAGEYCKDQQAHTFKTASENRKKTIQTYLWNESTGYFFDYHIEKRKQTQSMHLGGTYPLFFHLTTQEQAHRVEKIINTQFLYPGGLITTTIESPQQWDAPNAWAPLQYMTVKGLENYNCSQTAETIKENWCQLVEKTFASTGKLMEKYNAVNIDAEGGGGEYPNQDGFGWTNGVYLAFKKRN